MFPILLEPVSFKAWRIQAAQSPGLSPTSRR
jgi:hypothetical protein